MNHCGFSFWRTGLKGMAFLGRVVKDNSASHEMDVVDIPLLFQRVFVSHFSSGTDSVATTPISFAASYMGLEFYGHQET